MKSVHPHDQLGIGALLGMVLAIATIWMVVLPAASKIPTVRNHLEFLESKRVNAAAMFYTELEPKE
jgi:predicted RND superfamily exporter protein